MDREKILQASRNENQNKDIYELEVIRRGQNIGGLIAICIAFTLMAVEAVFFESGANYGFLLIILSAGTGLWIYKAVKLKRKHEIAVAVLYTLLSVYATIMVVLGYIR